MSMRTKKEIETDERNRRARRFFKGIADKPFEEQKQLVTRKLRNTPWYMHTRSFSQWATKFQKQLLN